MSLILRSGVQDKRHAYIPLIAAQYCSVQVEQENSIGKAVLETPDGPVFGRYSMAKYIAKFKGDNALLGSSVYEDAQVEEWMEFAAREIEKCLKRWIYPEMDLGLYDPHHCLEMCIGAVQHCLRVLNTHLTTNTNYLVGNRITLADIAMVCALHFGFSCAMTKPFTSLFPHVERYFWNLVGQPNFEKILGEVKQTESMPLEWPGGPTVFRFHPRHDETLNLPTPAHEMILVETYQLGELRENPRRSQASRVAGAGVAGEADDTGKVLVDLKWTVAQKHRRVNQMQAHKKKTVIMGDVA